MDPLCHTLVGATLGCTGLEKTTRYSRATLIIAANLPDIDVVTHFLGGTASYGLRRGITHGIPALVVLPVLLAGAVLAWHRLRGSPGTAPSPRALLGLALIGVWTHPFLDWMNTYGMRWLMPMVNEWYYGDTLFIMDWVMWLALAVGLLTSRFASVRRSWFLRPASVALAFVLAYIGANAAITWQAEARVRSELAADPPGRILASPVPFDPFVRDIVMEYPDHYRFATNRAGWPARFGFVDRRLPKGSSEDLELAQATRDGRWFMHWARFPYTVSETDAALRRVTIADARYVPDVANPRLDGFAVYVFEVPAEPGIPRASD